MKWNGRILWVFLLVITLTILWNTQLSPTPFPVIFLDEHAHFAYTMHLIRLHRWWPDYDQFVMFDPLTRAVIPDYINHPPTFYWLMKILQQPFPEVSPLRWRMVPGAFYLLGFACYARVGYRLALTWPQTVLYVLLPFLLNIKDVSGFYSNDGVAVAGGMLVCLASTDWFNGQRLQRAALLMLLGLALASVKLTSFILVGGYTLCALLVYRQHLRQLPTWVLPAGICWALVLSLPFLYLSYLFGSPAPNTPGQLFMLRNFQSPWWHLPQQISFWNFLKMSLPWFTTLTPGKWLIVPLSALIGSYLLFLLLPARRRALPEALRAMTGISLACTLLMLTAHVVFSYQRYCHYHWIYDMLLRYYYPLLPAYGASVAAGYLLLRRQR